MSKITTATELADRIAAELLTVDTSNGPVKCTRMQLMLGDNGSEKNMGGRCHSSMVFKIQGEIQRWVMELAEAIRSEP